MELSVWWNQSQAANGKRECETGDALGPARAHPVRTGCALAPHAHAPEDR